MIGVSIEREREMKEKRNARAVNLNRSIDLSLFDWVKNM